MWSLQTRRQFLEFMGKSTIGLGLSSPALLSVGCQSVSQPNQVKSSKDLKALGFSPIEPSSEDEVVLADGLSYNILISWRDEINAKGDRFGSNNDYIAFLPDPGSSRFATLWVNHESYHPLFTSGNDGKNKTPEQIKTEQKEVGGSILRIKRSSSDDKVWSVDKTDSINQRIDALTPIAFAGAPEVAGSAVAIGTLANCAGGVTPWGTVLTCEENYQHFYGDNTRQSPNEKRQFSDGKQSLKWTRSAKYPPEHYGWVVEIDTSTGNAKKLVGLGRFSHECATTIKARDGRCVVYSGDDANDECLYKFISETPNNLDSGELFVANIDKGEWVSLSIEKQEILKKYFTDQLDVLIHCREAARLVGGTPLHRPEDIEIDPKNNAVYVAQTNNKPKGDYHGSILKLEEDFQDPLSLKFKAKSFVTGGKDSGFSCPDNLVFDQKGNLWMTSDISGSKIDKGPYNGFKNNGLFYIPLSGPNAGQVFQVASAPKDAEFTGPCFSQDGSTLFLSVQHPGETSKSLEDLTSHWPDGGNELPKSSVIMIHGPLLEQLTKA